jgi:hypothetical protein
VKGIDDDLQNAFAIADLFFEGISPAPGGSLDQTKWFMDFSTRMRSEENRINAAKNEK